MSMLHHLAPFLLWTSVWLLSPKSLTSISTLSMLFCQSKQQSKLIRQSGSVWVARVPYSVFCPPASQITGVRLRSSLVWTFPEFGFSLYCCLPCFDPAGLWGWLRVWSRLLHRAQTVSQQGRSALPSFLPVHRDVKCQAYCASVTRHLRGRRGGGGGENVTLPRYSLGKNPVPNKPYGFCGR